LALALIPQVLGLGLALILQVLGLGLVESVPGLSLSLGLESQVLVNITGLVTPYPASELLWLQVQET